MIHDIRLTPLKQIETPGGKVMHMLKASDPVFAGFGEMYFSTVEGGVVKAWKRHLRMTLNLVCVHGSIRFVAYDARPDSPTFGRIQEIQLGPDNYQLATIPPGLWGGFSGISAETSILANCASIPHDPAEVERCGPRDPMIPYEW